MTQAGLFTPADARMVLDAAKFVRDNGFALRALLRRTPLAMPDPAFPPIKFRNDSGETCPAYACMEVTGTATVGGRTVFTIDKPSTHWGGPYLFNLHRDVANGEYGLADAGVEVFGLSDRPTAAGYRFGPQAGSWSLQETVTGPFMQAADEANIGSGVARLIKQPNHPQIKVFYTPVAGINARSAGKYGKATCTMRILTADGSGNLSPSNQTDSTGATVTETVHNMGSDPVGGSEDIQAVWIDGFWIANWEEC